MEELNEQDIKKAVGGDRQAFDRVITAYKRTVASVCLKYMRNNEEACDMAQEVFCKAYEKIGSFKFDSKLSTWLYRVAVNMCINRLDMLKRRKYYETDSISGDESCDKDPVDVADAREGQDILAEKKQLRECVMEAMEGFESAERSVVILRDLEGMEYNEIGKVLKIPLGSVKSKLSRAREKLKQKLARKLGEKNEL